MAPRTETPSLRGLDRAALLEMDLSGLEAEADRLRLGLNDPDSLAEVEQDLAALRLEGRQQNCRSWRFSQIVNARTIKNRQYQAKSVFVSMRKRKDRQELIIFIHMVYHTSPDRIENNVLV